MLAEPSNIAKAAHIAPHVRNSPATDDTTSGTGKKNSKIKSKI